MALKTTTTLLASLTLSAALLSGCGQSGSDADGGTTNVSSDFNDADVTFAQTMIPHHEQAVMMSQMAEGRAEDERVRELAADIEAAQQPEIDLMTGWLEAWGEDVPSGMGHGGDHGMGDMDAMDMPGMMSDADLDDLEGSSGSAWDRMFLVMMIEHHEGAIEMAQEQQTEGENPEAIALAEKIERDQKAEIAMMESWLEE